MKTKNHSLLYGTLAFLVIGTCPSVTRAGFIAYQVTVNTSALSGQGGNLDFQFNPGSNGAESAIASVANFQTLTGVLSQPAMLTGDASGSLPGPLTLKNSTAYNDAFQGFTFDTRFSFLLTLSGQAIDNPGGTSGSSFALSLYDAAGVTPLLTTDPNGSVFTINLNTDGTNSIQTFAQSPTINTSVVTITPATSVPEPSSFVIMFTLLLSILSFQIGNRLLWRIRGKCFESLI